MPSADFTRVLSSGAAGYDRAMPERDFQTASLCAGAFVRRDNGDDLTPLKSIAHVGVAWQVAIRWISRNVRGVPGKNRDHLA